MDRLAVLRELLQQEARKTTPTNIKFYKTGIGQYAEHDKFIGVCVPALRKLAIQFKDLLLPSLKELLSSPFNEERLLALLILVGQYERGDADTKLAIYLFYLENISNINNWNLVDASAHLIIGAYLYNKDKSPLVTLARSEVMWERRIAIVATWYFIRKHSLECTLQLAEILLNDKEDLIHKAVGWMLRELGKRDTGLLVSFLDKHSNIMPRTMLRYAIEKFPEAERKHFMLTKKLANT